MREQYPERRRRDPRSGPRYGSTGKGRENTNRGGESENYAIRLSEQEVELISTYLQIQKMRFGKRLNYQIEVDEEIKKKKMPKLVLQPFVENAVVHGFENVESPGYLMISGQDEKYFSKVFKKVIGMTPREYRMGSK